MRPSSVPFDPEILVPDRSTSAELADLDAYGSQHIHQFSLPASFRNEDDNLEPSVSSQRHLSWELDVTRLNEIHTWLWMVGRPMPPRPLHHQKVLGREVVITERTDLHLVWDKSRIFIKPIPRFLLDSDFWRDHLLCKPNCLCSIIAHEKTSYLHNSPAECTEKQLYKCAAGFLLSYAGLICHESDFHIARSDSLCLLPSSIAWPQWVILVQHLLTRCSPHRVNERYLYGELRLSRLNAIYRLTGRSIFRGYVSGYREYSEFFRASFIRIFAVFAYVTIVLTAMQVALATQKLGNNVQLQQASYGFAVFSILGPLGVLLIVLSFMAVAFINHLLATVKYRARRKGAFVVREKECLERGVDHGA